MVDSRLKHMFLSATWWYAINVKNLFHADLVITKTRLYNFDPLKPHFHIVKLGFTGVNIIFLFC